MNPDDLTVLICRSVGLLLFILGFPYLLPVAVMGVREVTGTGFYATPNRRQLTLLFIRHYFVHLIHMCAGLALLFFDRFFGHLLALGLFHPAT